MSVINFDPDEKSRVARAAKLSLAANPNFLAYLEELRAVKDVAVRDMVNDSVVGDVNKMMAAAGSVRTYLDILDDFQNIATDLDQSALDEQKEN